MNETFNEDGVIRGFYYDHQLKNPLTRVSLYSNTVMDPAFLTKLQNGNAFSESAEGKEVNTANMSALWRDVGKGSDKKGLDLVKNEELEEGEGDHPYSKTPIASSILTEDFQVDIANNWGEQGGDPLGSMWNNVKGLGPYLAKIGDFLKSMSREANNYSKSVVGNGDKWGKKSIDYISKGSKVLGEITKDKAASMMNRGLSVQGTQFSYYGGTGINFGNMSMKFTIFPDFDNDGNFVSVINKIESIIPYCIGPFIPVDLKEISQTFGTDPTEFTKEFAHWQLPPGGFEPDLKNIDVVQRGTLKLVIGSYYAVTNLVVSGCNLSFSKQLVKNPQKIPGQKDYLSPMYCDVNLVLKPATKYSYNSMLRFIKGNATRKLRDQLDGSIGRSFHRATEYTKSLNGDLYYV